MTEQYKCPSFYDDNNVLRDCTCGMCGSTDFREQVAELFYRELRGKTLTVEQKKILDWAEARLKPAIVKLHETEVERIIGSDEPQTENGLLPDRVERRNQLRSEQRQRAAITPKEDE